MNHGFSREEMDVIYKAGTTARFDEVVWCKRLNLKTVMDFYERFSLMDRMQRFTVPVLFINTRDDRIASSYAPIDRFEKNKNISFVMVNKGDHLGTVTKDGMDLASRIALGFVNAE